MKPLLAFFIAGWVFNAVYGYEKSRFWAAVSAALAAGVACWKL